MKKILILCLLLPLFLFAETPEEVVQKMVNDLKATRDVTSTLNYVHWPTAFARMTAPEKQNLGVTSAQQLKEVVTSFLKDPKKMFQDRMQSSFKDLPPEQAKTMQQMMDQQMQQVEAEKQKRISELGRAEFVVDKAVINGKRASVNVTESIDGKSTVNTIELMDIDGQWYIAYNDNNSGGAAMGGAPSNGGGTKPTAPKPVGNGAAVEF